MSKLVYVADQPNGRQTNPKLWDAAKALASEWNISFSQVKIADAQWRLLQHNYVSSWAAWNYNEMYLASEGLIRQLVDENKIQKSHKYFYGLLVGFYASPLPKYLGGGTELESIERSPQLEHRRFPDPCMFLVHKIFETEDEAKRCIFCSDVELQEAVKEQTGLSTTRIWKTFVKDFRSYRDFLRR